MEILSHKNNSGVHLLISQEYSLALISHLPLLTL